jgi:hypothetical protein
MEQPSNYIIPGMLKYTEGPPTLPKSPGLRYIIQILNNHGQYLGSIANLIANRWPAVETNYRRWYRENYGRLKLGSIQTNQVQSDTIVINMIAADGTEEDDDGNPPLKYEALEQCLGEVGKEVSYNNGSIHLSRIGINDDTGGDWGVVEGLLVEQLIKRGINVTIYDPPN